MSSGPRRSETKYSHFPSGDQNGLWLTELLSVTVDTAPSLTSTVTMRLGERLPRKRPSCEYSRLPDAQVIVAPSGLHWQADTSLIRARSRECPSASRRYSESPCA